MNRKLMTERFNNSRLVAEDGEDCGSVEDILGEYCGLRLGNQILQAIAVTVDAMIAKHVSEASDIAYNDGYEDGAEDRQGIAP